MEHINETALRSSLNFHGPSLARVISSSISSNDERSTAAASRIQLSLQSDQHRDRNESASRISERRAKNPQESKFFRRLHEFIADNFEALYQQRSVKSKDEEKEEVAESEGVKIDAGNDLACGACPALETYFDISGRRRKERLFMDIRVGDYVCGEIRAVEEAGITVRLHCIDSPPLQRDLEDLRLDVFIPRHELIVTKAAEDPFSIYCKHKSIRAVVSGVNAEKNLLTVALKSAPSPDLSVSRRLGIISESELPAYFRANQAAINDVTYDDVLTDSRGFQNPNSVNTLCHHFGLSMRNPHSFSSVLRSRINEVGQSAKELRKVQSYRLAMKSVVKGVERLRNKQNAEAMQHFNKALEIDPDNVEGLVGRGALYANCESFEFAIRDFDQALAIDPNHANAQLYLIETLLAQGKTFEKSRRRQKAQSCYERVLKLSPADDEAIKRLKKLNPQKMMGKRRLDSDSNETIDINSSDEESRSKAKKRKVAQGTSPEKTGKQSPRLSGEASTKHLRGHYRRLAARADVGDPALVDKLKRYYDYYSRAMKRKRHSSETSIDNDSSKSTTDESKNSSGENTTSSSISSESGSSSSASESESDSSSRSVSNGSDSSSTEHSSETVAPAPAITDRTLGVKDAEPKEEVPVKQLPVIEDSSPRMAPPVQEGQKRTDVTASSRRPGRESLASSQKPSAPEQSSRPRLSSEKARKRISTNRRSPQDAPRKNIVPRRRGDVIRKSGDYRKQSSEYRDKDKKTVRRHDRHNVEKFKKHSPERRHERERRHDDKEATTKEPNVSGRPHHRDRRSSLDLRRNRTLSIGNRNGTGRNASDKATEDVKLTQKLSDMENFIAGLKSKKQPSDNV